jgi:hypothetical protein
VLALVAKTTERPYPTLPAKRSETDDKVIICPDTDFRTS